MTLQRRLMLTLTGVTATVLIASFLTVFLMVRRDEVLALDEALFLQARVVSQEIDGQNGSQIVLSEGTADVPESLTPTTRFIAVYDAAGEPVVASRSFGGDAPTLNDLGFDPPEISWEARLSLDLDVRDHRLRGVVVPLGQSGASLLYAASRRTITEDTRFLVRMLSVLLLASVVGTALIARWLGKLLARDVQTIAGVARRVTDGDLSARVGSQARGSIETRLLAVDLDDMVERLGALVQAQRDFIAHAAHELRSPLTTLRGELQLALRRPRSPDEYRQAVQEVLEDVESLTRLADELLALARIQSRGPSTVEQCTIADVVESAVSMARGAADPKGVLIENQSEKAAGASMIAGSRGELARAVRNVLDNAIHHSPHEGVVTFEYAVDDDRVVISIIDQGSGVPIDDRPKIFSPFFRGSAGGDQPGAGLGLAIARGIVEGLGGSIILDAEYGPGAKFVLSLPRHRRT